MKLKIEKKKKIQEVKLYSIFCKKQTQIRENFNKVFFLMFELINGS